MNKQTMIAVGVVGLLLVIVMNKKAPAASLVAKPVGQRSGDAIVPPISPGDVFTGTTEWET
ncbi:hypothetical protein [Aquabacterium sp.]|uniref:hypothetical protein n=1 Tax=Aquabacterium sp. TaxID=1872578 RepID=UPI0025C51D3F|nr:hypothetical protein [Aquabacterium sp.]